MVGSTDVTNWIVYAFTKNNAKDNEGKTFSSVMISTFTYHIVPFQ
jgi:hypothetical protein